MTSYRRRCRQCGSPFLPRRPEQIFCNKACKRAWHSWREARGARAIELLIRWRANRKVGSLSALARFADEVVADWRDHEAGRAMEGASATIVAHPSGRIGGDAG